MNIPFGMMVEADEDRLVDSDLQLAHCHDANCPGHELGFLFFEETELCPFVGCEDWS